MDQTSAIAAALAPGVALTSAVIYWANLQSRFDLISGRIRGLNAELRGLRADSARTASVKRQLVMLTRRTRVLHLGVLFSVLALVGLLGSSAAIFVASSRPHSNSATVMQAATGFFMVALISFGASLCSTLWEMLWARRSLEEDVRGSEPLAETTLPHVPHSDFSPAAHERTRGEAVFGGAPDDPEVKQP